jgi:hypothetical protein
MLEQELTPRLEWPPGPAEHLEHCHDDANGSRLRTPDSGSRPGPVPSQPRHRSWTRERIPGPSPPRNSYPVVPRAAVTAGSATPLPAGAHDSGYLVVEARQRPAGTAGRSSAPAEGTEAHMQFVVIGIIVVVGGAAALGFVHVQRVHRPSPVAGSAGARSVVRRSARVAQGDGCACGGAIGLSGKTSRRFGDLLGCTGCTRHWTMDGRRIIRRRRASTARPGGQSMAAEFTAPPPMAPPPVPLPVDETAE